MQFVRASQRLVAFAVLLSVSGCRGAEAAPSDAPTCSLHFVAGMPPQVVNARMRPRTTALCYQAFSVLFSGLTRTPLWSAERLTRDAATTGASQDRIDSFHEEPRLLWADRSYLSDYSRSGFDRGHMTPSGDMPSPVAQQESFSLANMVPQAAELNRYSWADLERGVRRLAEDRGDIFVVTGPVYQGSHIPALKGRVYVPTSTYKAVYLPGVGAEAFVSTNTDNPSTRVMSIVGLRELSGIDPFPALSEGVKGSIAVLVHIANYQSRPRRSYGDGWGQGVVYRYRRRYSYR